ncbi:MAG: DUF1345 domain-containing protein [Burkholderiales bacterium]|nr:DUF1345 domain-containing protein [Burkholderiales bacterium]
MTEEGRDGGVGRRVELVDGGDQLGAQLQQGMPCMNLWTQLRLRPRLLFATLCGGAFIALGPNTLPLTTRLLLGWDITLWIYLPLALWMMLGRAGSVNVQERANRLTEGLPVMLLLAVTGALASFGAIALELASAREAHAASAPALAFAVATVARLRLQHRRAGPGHQHPGRVDQLK